MTCFEPIGTIHSPFTEVNGMPIQPVGAQGVAGSIEVLPAFQEGLRDLEGFSHIIVIYHFHRISGYSLLVKPFLDNTDRGVFATRSPRRPNSIGISVLRLTGIAANVLHVENVDILDGTPVLDIKPYVPKFDVWDADRVGWFAGKVEKAESRKSDERFM
jgi:tRNA-Thr(GGU) m(6)t(6)A37 methyltransferase TsaA